MQKIEIEKRRLRHVEDKLKATQEQLKQAREMKRIEISSTPSLAQKNKQVQTLENSMEQVTIKLSHWEKGIKAGRAKVNQLRLEALERNIARQKLNRILKDEKRAIVELIKKSQDMLLKKEAAQNEIEALAAQTKKQVSDFETSWSARLAELDAEKQSFTLQVSGYVIFVVALCSLTLLCVHMIPEIIEHGRRPQSKSGGGCIEKGA